MNALYLVQSEIDPSKGISKKIQAQVNALNHAGLNIHLCHYDNNNGVRSWAIDGKPIARVGKSNIAHIKYYTFYSPVLDYVKINNIQFIYFRYSLNATPFLIRFLRKLKVMGVVVYMEIPTYPYDGESKGQTLLKSLQLWIEKKSRNHFKDVVERIVTFSIDHEIFGTKTICLSNAVDLKALRLKHIVKKSNTEIHLLGVANLMFWHGYDRLIAGLASYYKKTPTIKVIFDIAGGGPLLQTLQEQAEQLGVSQYVNFLGIVNGIELDEAFDQADIAVGCLGCHRKNIKEVKSLKNVEYAARGIPFIYSENNNDFDNQEYIIKVPANESPILVEDVLSRFNSIQKDAQTIRNSVAHLTWECQMGKVVSYLTSK